jgi:hypothetical protein
MMDFISLGALRVDFIYDMGDRRSPVAVNKREVP